MKIPGSKRLHFKPHFKPSSLGVPLSDRSAQSISVHTGWPKAEMDRLWTLSSCRAYFNNAKKVFIDRLRRHRCSPNLLRMFEDYEPEWEKYKRTVRKKQNECKTEQKTRWLVLPGHPQMKTIKEALHIFRNSDETRALEHQIGQFMSFDIKVSVKNPGKHLIQLLRGL